MWVKSNIQLIFGAGHLIVHDVTPSVTLIILWNCVIYHLLGHHKCRDVWPSNAKEYERAYNLFLDGILLVIPLIMLGATYSLITRSLWQGMRTEKALKNHIAFDSTQSCMYITKKKTFIIKYQCFSVFFFFIFLID